MIADKYRDFGLMSQGETGPQLYMWPFITAVLAYDEGFTNHRQNSGGWRITPHPPCACRNAAVSYLVNSISNPQLAVMGPLLYSEYDFPWS